MNRRHYLAAHFLGRRGGFDALVRDLDCWGAPLRPVLELLEVRGGVGRLAAPAFRGALEAIDRADAVGHELIVKREGGRNIETEALLPALDARLGLLQPVRAATAAQVADLAVAVLLRILRDHTGAEHWLPCRKAGFSKEAALLTLSHAKQFNIREINGSVLAAACRNVHHILWSHSDELLLRAL